LAAIFVLTLLSVEAQASELTVHGLWQLDGEIWGGKLTAPAQEENPPGVEKLPRVTKPGWNQKLNLALAWEPSASSGFNLELMDSGNWGVGYASDGSWGRQSTFGPFLIHQAFGSYAKEKWHVRAGRLQPTWDNSLLGGAPIALEGLEGGLPLGGITVGAGAFQLSSLYWPGTDYVVETDTLFSLSLSGRRENLAWNLLAVPDEFGSARALGGKASFGALGGVISGEAAVWQGDGKAAPAFMLSGNWQWKSSAFSLAVAMADPKFAPILSSLSGQAPDQLLSQQALPFTTGSGGLAASWGRRLGNVVLELHGAARKVEDAWQQNLGAALYLPQSGGEFSLALDFLKAESKAARLKAGWEISF
jgi:hypothetical protein